MSVVHTVTSKLRYTSFYYVCVLTLTVVHFFSHLCDSLRLEPIIPDENASSKSNQTNKKYWIDEGLLHLK